MDGIVTYADYELTYETYSSAGAPSSSVFHVQDDV